MKKKIITTLFIMITIILVNIIIPKTVNAAKPAEEVEPFAEDVTWEWEYTTDKANIPYGLLIPSNAEEYEVLPMIVHLHGWGAGGTSEQGLYGGSIPKAIIDMEQNGLESCSVYVLCPHLRGGRSEDVQWGNNAQNIAEIIDMVVDEYNIDPEKIIITGESRGGTGALELALALPDYFTNCIACSPYTQGPFNTSIETVCLYSYSGDADSAKYSSSWESAFGEDHVFSNGSGHGSVGYSFAKYDDNSKFKYGIERRWTF